jgi:hypothetical protein
MKRSNIIIISTVLLLISWLLISGWLQALSYNTHKSGGISKYTEIIGNDRVKTYAIFKNIKIDFQNKLSYPKITVYYSNNQEITFSKNLEKQYTYKISHDTLYLSINYSNFDPQDFVNIGIPRLNSLKLSSNSKWSGGGYSDVNHNISVSGFNANQLTLINNCQYEIKLENNKLKKLAVKGDFHKDGKVNIANYPDYDSLDVDIQGNNGTLILSKYSKVVENKRQWISIRVPSTFIIEAEAGASIWSHITIKSNNTLSEIN